MSGYPNAQNNPAGAAPSYATAQPQGGASPYFNGALLAVAATVKSSAGSLFALVVQNPNATGAWVQAFDKASPTVGTDTPALSLWVPGSSYLALPSSALGVKFANAIVLAATTTATGSTAPVGALVVNALFA